MVLKALPYNYVWSINNDHNLLQSTFASVDLSLYIAIRKAIPFNSRQKPSEAPSGRDFKNWILNSDASSRLTRLCLRKQCYLKMSGRYVDKHSWQLFSWERTFFELILFYFFNLKKWHSMSCNFGECPPIMQMIANLNTTKSWTRWLFQQSGFQGNVCLNATIWTAGSLGSNHNRHQSRRQLLHCWCQHKVCRDMY